MSSSLQQNSDAFPDANTPSLTPLGNPVIPVYAADPHAELFGDKYYVFATHAGIYSSSKAFHDKVQGEEHGFAAWSSTDIRHWKSEGRILRFTEVEWARDMGDAWAPCMAERNGRYYFYFCADSCIGVVVGDSPLGPFADVLRRPLIPFRTDLSSIDPMVFIDDDGQAYLYWGAVPGPSADGTGADVCMHLSVQRLGADMMSLEGDPLATIETHKVLDNHLVHIEASHVFKRQGIYYLMWSPGSFASNDDERAYRVYYATSKAPLGPWKQAPNNPVLSTRRDVGVVGPGHHSTLQIPGTDEWFCVYHCHKGDVERHVFIDRMTFDSQGAIETIVPTLEGPPPRPVHLALWVLQRGPYRPGEAVHLEAEFLNRHELEIRRVEFFAGATKVGESTLQVPICEWRPSHAGFYRLTARVTLAGGEIITSAPRNVDVWESSLTTNLESINYP